jgi:hypothetical protein
LKLRIVENQQIGRARRKFRPKRDREKGEKTIRVAMLHPTRTPQIGQLHFRTHVGGALRLNAEPAATLLACADPVNATSGFGMILMCPAPSYPRVSVKQHTSRLRR